LRWWIISGALKVSQGKAFFISFASPHKFSLRPREKLTLAEEYVFSGLLFAVIPVCPESFLRQGKIPDNPTAGRTEPPE
jgi:hypothetical protein